MKFPIRETVPPTLRSAVGEADCISLPACERQKYATDVIRNFLGHKFAVAYCLAQSTDESERLKNLWESIIGEEHHS